MMSEQPRSLVGASVADQPSLEEAAVADPFEGADPFKGGDIYKWALDQSALILAGRFGQVDIINVADEIESVGKAEFRAFSSNLEIVIVHILKWDHQPQRRSRSWVDSIEEHRSRVELTLSESPSMKARIDAAIAQSYRLACYVAARETRLSRKHFPEVCPYDWETIMTRPFSSDRANEAI